MNTQHEYINVEKKYSEDTYRQRSFDSGNVLAWLQFSSRRQLDMTWRLGTSDQMHNEVLGRIGRSFTGHRKLYENLDERNRVNETKILVSAQSLGLYRENKNDQFLQESYTVWVYQAKARLAEMCCLCVHTDRAKSFPKHIERYRMQGKKMSRGVWGRFSRCLDRS